MLFDGLSDEQGRSRAVRENHGLTISRLPFTKKVVVHKEILFASKIGFIDLSVHHIHRRSAEKNIVVHPHILAKRKTFLANHQYD